MLIESLWESLSISYLVFSMMCLSDILQISIRNQVRGRVFGGFGQYLVASFLGMLPGCMGPYLCISLYMEGLIGVGAVVGSLIATAGDESFMMFSLFPLRALYIHLALFVLGIVGGYLADIVLVALRIKRSQLCDVIKQHGETVCYTLKLSEVLREISLKKFVYLLILTGLFLTLINYTHERISLMISFIVASCAFLIAPEHYLREHIFEHILKRHLWRIFLWTTCIMVSVEIAGEFIDPKDVFLTKRWFVFPISALIGLIPISGPHIAFVVGYDKGLIPISMLLVNSVIQDGHGLLPLIPHSLRDFAIVKAFKFVYGTVIGLVFLSIGL